MGHDCDDHQSNTSGFGLKILRTPPLSGRQEARGAKPRAGGGLSTRRACSKCRSSAGIIHRPCRATIAPLLRLNVSIDCKLGRELLLSLDWHVKTILES